MRATRSTPCLDRSGDAVRGVAAVIERQQIGAGRWTDTLEVSVRRNWLANQRFALVAMFVTLDGAARSWLRKESISDLSAMT